jgi:hypothetical protein
MLATGNINAIYPNGTTRNGATREMHNPAIENLLYPLPLLLM